MALLDSTVELRKRAESYGMSDASCDKLLKEAPTLAALAFVLGGQPGSKQEESLQKWTDALGALRLENGALEVSQQNHVKSVDVTDGLRMAACLHRRAAAMAIAGLISYGVAQKWNEIDYGIAFLRFPSRKVLAADKEFWRILAEDVE